MCRSKLVPEHVVLFCFPVTSLKADLETIPTKELLQSFTLNKTGTAVNVNYLAAAFSYKYSKETQHIVDRIVRNNKILIVSRSSYHFSIEMKNLLFTDHSSCSFRCKTVVVYP